MSQKLHFEPLFLYFLRSTQINLTLVMAYIKMTNNNVCCAYIQYRAADKGEKVCVLSRSVVKLVTPGTLVEPLSNQANYLLCLHPGPGDSIGLAWAELSTTELCVSSTQAHNIEEDIERISPSEVYNTHTVYSGKFSGLNFVIRPLKAYFCGLVLFVCPKHVIIVAYYLFSWVKFSFGGSLYKPNENFKA